MSEKRLTELRYRYQSRDGRPIWLAFDPNFLCVYCDRPVGALSLGGPAICPTCDCGRHPDGRAWDATDMHLFAKAWRRFDAMPADPIWEEYEAAHRAAIATTIPRSGAGAK